ncbi:carbohydrate ABC transporter permease [Haloferax sp. Atlit-12N]|uniref:carbohydrate ABC transporter permease n=1 Tax=Haloferax sp. Atlit-12N TaxID=2077203 RepID=UPI000E22734D|nr:carbohydrate ABC transporter permease [Haloferax sp. Atlit-12N]RDZ62616.1 carbohydrate ABC transporter permease [Haloferax sp. Atlit-12N]
MSMKESLTSSNRQYEIIQQIGRFITGKYAVTAVLSALVLYFTFPVYWTFVSSIKTMGGIHAFPPNFIPVEIIDPIWKNYTDLWFQRAFNMFTLNSLVVAIVTTVLVVTFGTLAGYGFSRFRFPYDDYVFIGILGARLLPPIGMLVPFYRLFSIGELIDTRIALIMVYTYMNLPLVVWLMRNYFVSIPADLDEAAYIDGATRFQTFKDIILPLAKPGVAACAILTFLFSWREFLFAFVLTFTEASKTIPVGAMMMLEDVVILWNYLAAAGFIAMLPALLFVILFQRHIVSGLTAGAIKG